MYWSLAVPQTQSPICVTIQYAASSPSHVPVKSSGSPFGSCRSMSRQTDVAGLAEAFGGRLPDDSRTAADVAGTHAKQRDHQADNGRASLIRWERRLN